MKNLKLYSLSTFLAFFTSFLILSCSQDQEKTQENSITTNNTTNNKANKVASPACPISGSVTVSTGTYSYTYTNSGNNSIVNWTITQNGNPVPNTVVNVVTGQGSTTATINFSTSSNGIYRISAFGTGGSDGACEGILNVTKSGGTACCTPTFDAFYICDGTIKGKGAVVPFVNGCDVNKISSIVWNLGGAKWVAGPLAGLGNGTMLPPFSQYPKNIGYYQCQYGTFQISATYYFNNGCPPSTYSMDVTPTN